MSAWLQLTSGRGPAECRLAVQGVGLAMLEIIPGSQLLDNVEDEDGHGWLSALLSIEEEAQAKGWLGTLEWNCKSPIRPGHRRKRWFLGCSLLIPPTVGSTVLKDTDLEWTTMRSSGPGGQHVNKTESAVRLVHRPSGVTVTAREERSQHRNRSLALARLTDLLSNAGQAKEAERVKGMWQSHDTLERGNPVKRFDGAQFKLQPGT